MLLAHRRQVLLTCGLAGMQVAWFTPFALFVLRPPAAVPLLVTYAALFGVALLWLLSLDALNRRHVAAPRYELAVLGLVIFSTLFFLRLWLYSDGRPAADVAWLGSLGRTLFDLRPGVGRVLGVIVVNIILWQRAAAATGREPTFFTVGFSFRVGMLLLILGSALLELLLHIDPIPLLWCYFACGLLAIALARIEDKAYGAHSVGTPLPGARLLQLLLAVGVTVGLAALLAGLYSRRGIETAVAWLAPLWRVLDAVLGVVLTVLGWILTPVLLLLEAVMRWLLNSEALAALRAALSRLSATTQPMSQQPEGPGLVLPAWVATGFRYSTVLLGLLLLLGFVLLFLARVRQSRPREEAEDESREDLTLGGGTLRSALDHLRSLAGLARRYGLNRQLLAAVSVQNIYANVTRLARLRGHPRRPAQPPDAYLPALRQAFAGQDEALARITAAYMRVHYGDRPVTGEELAALRLDYHQVRHAPAPKRAKAASRRQGAA